MKLLVVGGHSRYIGKTSVVVAIISAFPEANWMAVKITQCGPGVCPINGENCKCAVDEHAFALNEESDATGAGDTCRFLAAGARRSFWVRAKRGRLAQAMPALRPVLEGGENVIIESNSVLELVRPTLYLVVLDPRVEDFKISSRKFLEYADAFLLRSPLAGHSLWQNIPTELFLSKPAFLVEGDHFFSAQVRDFVAARFLGLSAEELSCPWSAG